MSGEEEREEKIRPMLSMRSKLACISVVYLAFMGLTTILSVDPISRELHVLFDGINLNASTNLSQGMDSSVDDGNETAVEFSPINSSDVQDIYFDFEVEVNPQNSSDIHIEIIVREVVELELEWAFNTSDQFPGKSFGAGHMCAPTVWDIDNDGILEVIFGTRRGDSKRIWCLEGDGSFEWIYPPLSEDELPGDPTTKVSIVDVDNDGGYELALVSRTTGRLHVIRPDGSVLWTWDNPDQASIWGGPQAMDVDGDGFVEFFLSSTGKFFRVDHEGRMVWETVLGNNNMGHPTVCDIDQDGAFEILGTSDNYHVYCLDAGTGEEKWRFDTGGNIKYQPVIVLDVNGDGEYEALAWADSPLSGVVCISSTGEELWTWKHPREGVNIRLCQAIGDVDEDGSMDMAIMSGDAVFCVDIGGAVPRTNWEVNFTQWSVDGLLPEGARPDHWSSYQLIADIDGDDEQEILWLAPFPIVTDGATGALEAYYTNPHIAKNRRQESGGWWGDVDQDGISEWVCELNGNSHRETQVYCLSMDGKFPAKASWPEYYHAAYPAEYQQKQEWLSLKGAYSNSVWFPIRETLHIPSLLLVFLLIALMFRERSPLD